MSDLQEQLNQFGDDLYERRILVLGGKVTSEKATTLRNQLIACARHSNEQIMLMMNTEGGKGKPALIMVDWLKQVQQRAPVHGVVYGECSSAGIPILQACAKRIATPHSVFLIHSVSTWLKFTMNGDYVEERVQAELTEAQKTNAAIRDVLAHRSGNTTEYVQQLMRHGDRTDREYMAPTFKEMGFLDEVTAHPVTNLFTKAT